MQSPGGAAAIKPKKPKSRQVSSRFLSPTSSTTSSSNEYGGIPSPNSTLSPLRHNHKYSTDSRTDKSLENSGFLQGLWPSSANPRTPENLATQLGYDRLADKSILQKQRSCTEFSRFENEKQSTLSKTESKKSNLIKTESKQSNLFKTESKLSRKEIQKSIFGGSMRYTGKFRLNKSSNRTNDEPILPGRFSIDENSLRNRSNYELESEHSDDMHLGKNSPASYMAPTVSSRKHVMEVPSKFMNDLSSRSRRWSADSDSNSISNDNSPKVLTLKNAMKKANSKWAFSPGRFGSPVVDQKRNVMEFPSPKPPTSPSRGKVVGNILSKGIELFRGMKSSNSMPSPLGPGLIENVHQLRLLHNRLLQWRYSNAKADAVNANIIKQVQINFICAWSGLTKLQHSVVKKKLQLQKEKLEMKLNNLLLCQIKALEVWGNMEREYMSSISNTTDCLHSVVCKIPLVDGAKVELQSASVAVRHASDLAVLITSTITSFLPTAENTVRVLAELATVVTQEKLLLEECQDLFRIVSVLETQERNLRSSVMQLHQHNPHQNLLVSA